MVKSHNSISKLQRFITKATYVYILCMYLFARRAKTFGDQKTLNNQPVNLDEINFHKLCLSLIFIIQDRR